MTKTDTEMSPVNPGAQAREVLVIKLSALGDFVLALGAMKAVREMHLSARITLLTTPFFEEFGKLCPYVDRVETDGRPEGMKATAALIQRIRKTDYDIVYDFQTSGRTRNYFTALNRSGKAPLWSGHHEKAAFFHDNAERGRMHSIDRLAEQLEVAGVAPQAGRHAAPAAGLFRADPALYAVDTWRLGAPRGQALAGSELCRTGDADC